MTLWFVRISQFLFFIICSSMLLYMISKEVMRYMNNDDESSIEFKKFNASPEDKYPAFSLCFDEMKRSYGKAIYNTTLFPKLDRRKQPARYWKLITGKKNSTNEEIKSLQDFSSVTIKLKKLLQFFNPRILVIDTARTTGNEVSIIIV